MNITGVFVVCALTLLSTAIDAAKLKICSEEIDNVPPQLGSSPGQYEWVEKTAATIPYKCLFVYGGGYKRLLYVGRVRVGDSVLPASIHHYGRNGTENVHYSLDQQVKVGKDIPVEWLCAKGRVGWIRVGDLTDSTIQRVGAIPVGFDSVSQQLVYSCIVHSFFSDDYPASIGTIEDGNCVFEIRGQVVNSKDFTFWHTLEVLASL